MADRFDIILERLFAHEGGYADRPLEEDPGGATNFGITRATLQDYRGKPTTKREVERLTRDEAARIYRERYWRPIKGDDLPRGVDYAVFDAAVHSGPRRAAEWLQEAVGAKADGVVGPVTLRLVHAADARAVIRKVTDLRLDFLRALDHADANAGWFTRVPQVRDAALADAGEEPSHDEAGMEAAPNPASPILPARRPQQDAATTRAVVDAHRHLLPAAWRHAGVVVLFVRGYYDRTFGDPGNERGVYDDAAFLVTPGEVTAFNANADPSVYRRRVATLKAPQAVLYEKGKHGISRGPGYDAWRQASDVTVVRDRIGEDTDAPGRRFWINLHRGGATGTSSLGCLTIAPHQWDDFLARSYTATEEAGQDRLPVVLLEYRGGHPPVPAPVTADSPQEADMIPDIVTRAKDAVLDRLPDHDDEDHDPILDGPRPKPWWQSKTIIGAAMAGIALIASSAGYGIDRGDTSLLTDAFIDIIGGVGVVLAVFGRAVADRPVK